MPGGNVPYLMSHDSSHLGFIVQYRKDPTGEVNIASGQCKGVHHLDIQNLQLELEIRTVRDPT